MAGKLVGRSISETANLSIQTITVGNSTSNATINSTAVIVGNVTITASQITVGNSTVNTVLGQTGTLSGNGSLITSVNAIALQGNSVNDILTAANTAANTLASAAFSNAATRADSAYSNATSYASNADNITSGTLNTARLPATVNVSTAINVGANVNINTSAIFIGNSTVNTTIQAGNINLQGTQLTVGNVTVTGDSYTIGNSTVNTAITGGSITINGVNVNNSITSNAATAYSNATSYADTKAGQAFTNAASRADAAYSNAVSYAASNTYVNNTFLPLAGGTLTGALTINATANVVANLAANNVVVRGDIQIDGNLTVTGTSVTLNVASLAVEDNMIYLNGGSQVSHPDLGIAGNYNDGSYKHAGFFRDATDGVWKVFDGYTPEPDASAYIDTSNASFRIAHFTANVITANGFTGNGASITSVDAATVGSNTAATLRSYSDTVAATAFSNAALRADTAYSNAIAYSGNAALAFSNAAARADAAYTNATSYASNATNISSGTLNTARLPATVNVSTVINVGANVNINTSTVFVGNSTVNTSVSAGTITINGVNVNNLITSNNVGTFGNTTINGWANVSGSVTTAGQFISTVGNNTVQTLTWEKWSLETTGVTAKARQGSDGNGLNFTTNARWTGSAWAEDDTTKKKFAYIQHLGNGRHEFRTAATGAGITWVNSLILDDTSATFATNTATFGTAAYVVANGNVGIGTTSPSTRLTVTSNSAAVTGTYSTVTGARFISRQGGGIEWYLDHTNGYNGWVGAARVNNSGASWGDGYLEFLTSSGGGAEVSTLTMKNGNVGIGNTNPSRRLTIQAVGTGNYEMVVGAGSAVSQNATLDVICTHDSLAFQVWDDNNLTTPRFVVERGGDVGIGTTNPTSKLHVVGGFIAVDSSGGTDNYYLECRESGTTRFNIYENSDVVYLNSHNTMVFRANQTGGSGGSIRLDGGNVGIGTSPASKLSISGNTSSSLPIVDITASGTGTFQRGVRMLNSGMASGNHIMYALGYADNSKNMGQVYFYYDSSGSNSNRISMGLHSVDDVFNILGSGNIGIGTTTPSSFKLEIAGSIGPSANATYDLGSSTRRWSTVYTSDLDLSNGIGDWTIVEGEDDLFIYNNKRNKVYKFKLEEVDPSIATPKKENL